MLVAPPPAPNWMPTSGLAFMPARCTASISSSQSSVGSVMNPAEISMMSNPSSRHSAMYLRTASDPWVSTYSMNPPVETSTPCSWHSSFSSRTTLRGMSENDPPAYFRLST